MHIAPNTSIYILHNIPLDQSHNNTIYFPSEDAQSGYFMSNYKYYLQDYSYQRHGKNIRVNIPADDIYGCNYLMFKNTSFGNKWFYAFITGAEYINNETTEISFDIDDYQTWMFNITVMPSFVEREHSITDNIGDNIADESLTCGEYVYDSYSQLPALVSGKKLNDMKIVVGISDTEDDVDGGVYSYIYSGLKLYAFDLDEDDELNSLLTNYKLSPNRVTCMYMVPAAFVPSTTSTHRIPANNPVSPTYYLSFDALTEATLFGSYKPKNKKLYTYPFNFFHVDNNSNAGLNLRYEFFDSLKPVIQIRGTYMPPAQVNIRPCGYKGLKAASSLASYQALGTENCGLASYPACMWVSDAYEAWFAQNSVPAMLSASGSLALTTATGNPIAASGAINSFTSFLGGAYRASLDADITKGTFNCGTLNATYKEQTFNTSRVRITEEYAKMIDSYFSMFGYAVNQVKVPNGLVRTSWSYCKTNGANIIGNKNGGAPTDAITTIKAMYDKGFTLWRSGANVGNYTLDNSPIQTSG